MEKFEILTDARLVSIIFDGQNDRHFDKPHIPR